LRKALCHEYANASTLIARTYRIYILCTLFCFFFLRDHGT
jgi:hypothetical protein